MSKNRFRVCGFLVAGAILVAGCGRASGPDEAASADATAVSDRSAETAMTDFETLLASSVEELRLKTEAHTVWGLGTFDRWDIDQDVGNLVFSNEDGTRVVAKAQIIGSFSTGDNSWLWAWDNPSIVDGMKVDALKVKEYGETHGIEKLTSRTWNGTEEDGWAMAALATKLCGAQGVYRGPSGSAFVFMTFGEVTIVNSD